MTAVGTARPRISIRCSSCGARYPVVPHLLNRMVRCTQCAAVFRVQDVGDSPGGREGRTRVDPRLGTQLGPFRLIGVLGRGAMGTVYEAEDGVLKRRVAVKVLPREAMAAAESSLERFLREARSASRLEHPNIVTIYHVGREADTYFIAMQLVRGGSASDFIQEYGPLTPQDATRVTIEVAKALAAAHGEGVIHRDIKPANIMLGPAWSVKVADFGLAKMEGAETSAEGELVLGTPAYMSPETCRGGVSDARSDLYSLGATYYCLLTGRPPFRGETTREVMTAHVRDAMPDPRLIRPDIPQGCIDVLVKATEKDPAARYFNAEAMIHALQTIDFTGMAPNLGDADVIVKWATLAAEAQSELSGRNEPLEWPDAPMPVGSPRPSSANLPLPAGLRRPSAGRWANTRGTDPTPAGRMPAAMAAMAMVTACAVGWGLLRGPGRGDTHGGDTSASDRRRPILDVDPARSDAKAGGETSGPGASPAAEPDPVGLEFERLSNAASEAARRDDGLALSRALNALVAFRETHRLAADARHREFAVGARAVVDALGRIGDSVEPHDRPARATLVGHMAPVRALAFARSSAMLVSAGCDTTVRVWDTAKFREGPVFRKHSHFVAAVAVSADGQLVASAGMDKIVRLWRPGAKAEPRVLEAHTDWILALAVSPDGKTLASAGEDGTVRLWDLPEGTLQKTLKANPSAFTAVAFSSDGRELAAAAPDSTVTIWSLARKAEPVVIRAHDGAILALAYSPNGKYLATAGADSTVRVFDAVTHSQKTVCNRHSKGVRALAFSEGGTLASGGEDGTVRLWDPAGGREKAVLRGHVGEVCALAFSADGKLLASAGCDCAVKLWDIESETKKASP